MNRREFLVGSLAAAGLAGCGVFRGNGRIKPVAVQLWNLNKVFWDDPARYLAELKAAGYDGVEFAGWAKRGDKDTPAAEVRRLLSDSGLVGAGAHVNGKANWVGDGLMRMLDYCAEVGVESCTLPWYMTQGKAGWDEFVDFMGNAADEGARRGIRIGFHNHYHEFEQKIGDEFVWDYVFRNASPNLMQQVDTAQAIKTGVDPLALLKRYPTRNWYVHIKENRPNANRPNDPTTPVDLASIKKYLDADPRHRWYILEAEYDPTSIVPSVELLRTFDAV